MSEIIRTTIAECSRASRWIHEFLRATRFDQAAHQDSLDDVIAVARLAGRVAGWNETLWGEHYDAVTLRLSNHHDELDIIACSKVSAALPGVADETSVERVKQAEALQAMLEKLEEQLEEMLRRHDDE